MRKCTLPLAAGLLVAGLVTLPAAAAAAERASAAAAWEIDGRDALTTLPERLWRLLARLAGSIVAEVGTTQSPPPSDDGPQMDPNGLGSGG
jgi:hypothetical protein